MNINNKLINANFIASKSGVLYTENVSKFTSLLNVKAPIQDEDNKRPPLDICCVVDRSGSMGPHMKLLRETLEFVTNQLQDGDNFCIVTYHTSVTTTLPFTNVNNNTKEKIKRIIANIREEGCTNLAGGLFQGLHQVENNRRNDVASVLLLTDGLANSGTTKVEVILRQMRNHEFIRLYESELTTNESKTYTNDLAIRNCSVYTFGFGNNHNQNMLQSIAECGRGLYSFIKNADDIGPAFSSAIGGLMSIVAQNIDITFHHGMNAKVLNVLSNYPTRIIDDGIIVSLPDLMSGETRDIICELKLKNVHEPFINHPEPICSVTIKYHNRILKDDIISDPYILGIYRPDRNNFTSNMDQMNINVDSQLNRLIAIDAMDKASLLGDQNNCSKAREIIDEAINRLRESVSKHEEIVLQLIKDLQKCREGLRDEQQYRSLGSKFMKGMWHGHSKQRANVQCESSYAIPMQKKMKANWFSRFTSLE